MVPKREKLHVVKENICHKNIKYFSKQEKEKHRVVFTPGAIGAAVTRR